MLRGVVHQLGNSANKSLSTKTTSKLLRTLRSLALIWQSYLHHLPLSGGRLYPRTLEQGNHSLQSIISVKKACFPWHFQNIELNCFEKWSWTFFCVFPVLKISDDAMMMTQSLGYDIIKIDQDIEKLKTSSKQFQVKTIVKMSLFGSCFLNTYEEWQILFHAF